MTDDQKAIIEIPFHQDTLYVVRDGDVTRVAVKEISDRLGLDWSAQWRRIERNPILKEGIAIMAIPSSGGMQDTLTLPIQLLNGWLFGIQASRVAEHYRPAVLIYQRECYDVLFRHFFASRAGALKGPTYAAVQAMIRSEMEEAVRLMKGAIWGMTKGQTGHLDARHDRHDDDLTVIGVTALDTKEAIDRADLKSIGVILASRSIPTDRAFSNKCSVSLRDFCSSRGLLTARSPETRAHVFPSVAIGPWMQQHGNALIRTRLEATKAAAKAREAAAKDAVIGQTNLFAFPKPAS